METSSETHNVIAMRRSGHHAVVRWLLGHYATSTFHNDYLNGQFRYYRGSDDQIAGVYQYEDEGTGHCEVFNYEDFKFQDVDTPTILILRDPFNCFASRIKSSFGLAHAFDDYAVELWMNHARAYLSGMVYPVSYNQWVQDEQYRKHISDKLLRRPYTEAHLKTVSPFGYWSSFDGKTFDGKADEMDVLNRWRQYSSNPRFREMVNNPELVRLSKQIFGEIC